MPPAEPLPTPPPSEGIRSELSLSRIAAVWWPLAASWLLMGIELPLLTGVVERLADPEVNLAAYGSVVFPLSLIVEAPIIMLLAAATALVRDQPSYRRLHRFMMSAGALLTVVHVALAFTPLFDLICTRVLEVPAELVEPARLGMRIMTPWTWAIAYRRMLQGVLIRSGNSAAIGIGTLVRLAANVLAMVLTARYTDASGIVVGTAGVATGVTAEALFAGWLARPVVRALPARELSVPPLSWTRLLRFYAPLALTPLFTLTLPLVGSAAMARMRDPMLSLAAWPAVHGFVFLFRGVGMAYNEVVVALIEEPGAARALRRFSRRVAFGTMLAMALIVVSPLGAFWFGEVMHLAPGLAEATRLAVGLCLLMPGYQVLQSWYQGVLVARGETRAIPEAVALYLLLASLLLALAVQLSPWTGLYSAVLAFSCGGLLQTAWLGWRSRGHVRAFELAGASSPGGA